MNVGPFSFVALSYYVALWRPEELASVAPAPGVEGPTARFAQRASTRRRVCRYAIETRHSVLLLEYAKSPFGADPQGGNRLGPLYGAAPAHRPRLDCGPRALGVSMTTISKKQPSPGTVKTQEHDLELADQFQATQEQLVDAQNQLASLLVATATSPLVEVQLEVRRKEAQALRDELLRRYGAIALTWILRGGKVRFAFPDAPADHDRSKEPKRAPERTDDPPTPAAVARRARCRWRRPSRFPRRWDRRSPPTSTKRSRHSSARRSPRSASRTRACSASRP